MILREILASLFVFGSREWKAANKILYPKFGKLCIAQESELIEGEKEIARVREWTKTLSPRNRKAYELWLDFYTKDIARNREERKTRKQLDDFIASGKFPTP